MCVGWGDSRFVSPKLAGDEVGRFRSCGRVLLLVSRVLGSSAT